MSSAVYLLSKKIKNRITEAFHRPSEIIVIVIFFALMVTGFFSGNHASVSGEYFRDINELYAIVLALYSFIFVLTAKNGFVNGASMFSMADVNLIFTSPRKPWRVLTYGLLSQLGRSLMLGFFILYQYSWVHDTYGVGLSFLVAVLIGYGVTVFLSQMLAMLIYSLTSGSDSKNKIFKAVFYVVIAAFVLYVIYIAYLSNDKIAGAVDAANTRLINFFPVAGFVRLGIIGFAQKSYYKLVISIACVAAYCLIYFIIVSFVNADYYEDVLKASEVSFSAITARKEGKAVETAPRNVKVGRTGFTNGEGANAIYEKHKIENRRGKIALLDIVSIIITVITLVFAFIFKNALAAFAANAYISLFTIATGRWAKELSLPFVYLIPEPPFKKLLNMLKEQVPALITESVITFLPMCLFTHCTVAEAAAFCIAKISLSFVFIGTNLIFQRFFGDSENKTLIMFLYIVLAILLCVPCVIVFFLMTDIVCLSQAISLILASCVNVAISVLIIFCCRNVLMYSEYNNK